jgi:hypothetical protein
VVIKLNSTDKLENFISETDILYETEYSGKIFKNGQLIDNRIKYKKIKTRNNETNWI